jgi:hypothetical protein
MQDQALNPVDHYGTGYAWPLSPYSDVIANPQDILTDAAARLAFKKKLDYIVARYGYSANLGMYSILNEANGVENWQNSSSVRTDMMNWHCEMSSYLKNTYPTHLVTTGYTQTGTSRTTNGIKDDNTFSCGSIDLASCNHYSTSRDQHEERHDDIPKRVSSNWVANINNNIKPFIYGELGMTDCQPYSDQFTDTEFHNTIWSTSMYDNAIGNGLYWYDWEQKQGINHRVNFKALKIFTTDLNLSTDAYVSKWDFAGSVLKKNRKIEYIESRNTGRAKGYGWVKNADYFWINDPFLLNSFPNSSALPTSSCNETGLSRYNYAHHLEEITLHGLQALKRYNIDFWSCYGNGGNNGTGGINNKWSTIFGTLQFYKDVSVGPNIGGDPDFAYKLAKINTIFRTANDSGVPNDTLRFYKGRNCFEASGLQDDSDNNTHHWDFGNGQTSNLMDPLVCYEKQGTYLVTHSYKDTIGNTITQNQNIVVLFLEEINDNFSLNNFHNLKIYPNPTLSFISVVSSDIISDIYVYNQLGEMILFKQQINSLEYQISEIMGLNSGTYIIKIVYKNGENDFEKFIKM